MTTPSKAGTPQTHGANSIILEVAVARSQPSDRSRRQAAVGGRGVRFEAEGPGTQGATSFSNTSSNSEAASSSGRPARRPARVRDAVF